MTKEETPVRSDRWQENTFAGKTAVVTGASRGLGREITFELIRLGATVVAVSQTQKNIDRLLSEIAVRGGKVVGLACDVSDPKAVENTFTEIHRRLTAVDMLVNAAGIQGTIDWVVRFDPDEWDRIMGVNLKGPFLCCRAVLPKMIERGWGKIVNVAAGVLDERVDLGVAAYYASKAGLINFTRQLAAEVKRCGIFVNAIDPAGMDTGMSEEIMASEHASDEFAGTQTNRNPAIRLRPAVALVPMVIFLLSDASNMMTGRLLQASSPDDVQYLQL